MQKLYGMVVTVWSALIIVAMAVLVEEVDSAAMFDQNSAHFKAQQKSCSNLCGFCPSCNGFYCGEECICECRQDATEHVQCINKIRENSDKLGLIYDVLIQLPKSTTRFARSAGGKHLDPSDEATFRKVLFSNFDPKTVTETSTTTTHGPPLTSHGAGPAASVAHQGATAGPDPLWRGESRARQAGTEPVRPAAPPYDGRGASIEVELAFGRREARS
uniref:(northern house mosquito) hypothetical protein n=1 Tax=Culex pipiens TaxID=7175 RepID=A0A8D8NSS6_CULPI